MKNKKIVATRWDVLKDYAKGKDVLDIGCTELLGSSKDQKKKERWIHGRLTKITKKLTGIDINKKEVDLLNKKGYNIKIGDASTINLNHKFEVIFAGELIEHLSNPGLFLDNMRKHLKEDGVLILTTPNRFDALTFFRSLRRNQIPEYRKPIAKHVFYFDEHSITYLLQRHRLEPVNIKYYWTFGTGYDSWLTRLLLKPIIWFRPSFTRGLIIVAKKASKEYSEKYDKF